MPVYNGEKYLEDSIISVINQTYRNWELIVIDDFSIDRSGEIVASYLAIDERISYVRLQANSGSPSVPRNVGLNKAQGDFIAFLDCDDWWKPEKLQKQIEYLRLNGLDFVFCDYFRYGKSTRYFKSPKIINRDTLLKGNIIGCSTVLLSRDIIGTLRFVNCGHEDYLFWLSILSNNNTAVNVGDILVYYRLRNDSISGNKFKVFKWYVNIYKIVGNSTVVSILFTIRAIANSFIRKKFLSRHSYD